MARLFGRKNDKTTIAELEEYYSNQEKNRSPRAWLMALLSLLITVAVLVALFFAGRWLYNVITDDDSGDSETTTSQGEEVDVFVEDDSSTNDEEAEVEPDGVVSDEAATTNESDVAGTQDDVEVAIDEVPETGPEDLLLIVPVLIALLGYTYSIRRQAKN